MERRALAVARRLRNAGGVVPPVHESQRLDDTRPSVLGVALVGMEAVDVDPRDVDARVAGRDPVGQGPADAAAGDHADRVEARRDEVVPDLRRLAERDRQVGREALRAAEELPDPDVARGRDAAHRRVEEGRHAVPVRLDLAEGEVVGHAFHLPRRADGLEEADHEAAALFPVVAVTRRVLEDRELPRHPGERLGDQVVVLGRLVRDADAAARAELPRPHPGAVDDELRLDVAPRRRDPDGASVAGGDARDRHALDDRDAVLPGSLGQGHGRVHRVHPPVLPHVEAGQDVVDPREREEPSDLVGRDLFDVVAEVPVERRDPAVLLEAVRVRGQLDEAQGLEARAVAGLGLEAPPEIARVHAQLDRGRRGRAEGGHEARRVPGRAGGQPVALQQDDVPPAQLGQVIRHRAADHPASDDHDARPARQFLAGHRRPPPVCARTLCAPGDEGQRSGGAADTKNPASASSSGPTTPGGSRSCGRRTRPGSGS